MTTKKETTVKRGRPLKHGEPTQRRTFRFPLSFYEKLKKQAKKEKTTVTELIIVKMS